MHPAHDTFLSGEPYAGKPARTVREEAVKATKTVDFHTYSLGIAGNLQQAEAIKTKVSEWLQSNNFS